MNNRLLILLVPFLVGSLLPSLVFTARAVIPAGPLTKIDGFTRRAKLIDAPTCDHSKACPEVIHSFRMKAGLLWLRDARSPEMFPGRDLAAIRPGFGLRVEGTPSPSEAKQSADEQ